jgi:hypothetical protein
MMSLTEFSILKYLAVFAVLCPLELILSWSDKAAALGPELG